MLGWGTRLAHCSVLLYLVSTITDRTVKRRLTITVDCSVCFGQVTETPNSNQVTSNLAPAAWPHVTWKNDRQLEAPHRTSTPRRRQKIHYSVTTTTSVHLLSAHDKAILKLHCVSKKRHPFYFCDIFVRFHPILLIFGRNIHQEIWNKHIYMVQFIFRFVCSYCTL